MSDLISGERADLAARIDAELRERIEEAVEFLCLDALVERRRTLGLPPPAADSARHAEAPRTNRFSTSCDWP